MKTMRQNRIIFVCLLLSSVYCLWSADHCVFAQCTFDSGSTGADGDFIPTSSMPTNSGWSVSNDVATGKSIITLTNKSDGIFNFKSIYIETNYVVRFTKNTLNTPVWLLAQSNVTIKGAIDVGGGDFGPPPSVNGGIGGPGGFDGGLGGNGSPAPGSGFGPGGATQPAGGGGGNGGGFGTQGGGSSRTYGTLDIQPLIGGSGGAATCCGASGGGGAVLVASSMTIDISGSITANGGLPGSFGDGSGSGGAIRLIADTIQGEGLIQADGGAGEWSPGGSGRIRVESCTNLRASHTQPPATFALPGTVFLATNPTIRVASIAGTNTPAIPTGSLTVPDVYLPTDFVNPAVIKVAASNVTEGTSFKVIVIPIYGTNLIGTNTLVGSYAFSSNTVTMAVYTDRVWRVNALIDLIPRP